MFYNSTQNLHVRTLEYELCEHSQWICYCKYLKSLVQRGRAHLTDVMKQIFTIWNSIFMLAFEVVPMVLSISYFPLHFLLLCSLFFSPFLSPHTHTDWLIFRWIAIICCFLSITSMYIVVFFSLLIKSSACEQPLYSGLLVLADKSHCCCCYSSFDLAQTT